MKALGFLCMVLPASLALVFPAGLPAADDDPAGEPVVRAVSKVLPAVVNINTERVIRRAVQDPYDVLFYDFFGGPMRRPREFRQKLQSLGSGFIVDPEGHIVTNEHVVERAADLKIQVTTLDGKTYEAQYVAGDTDSDLAFIKIKGDKPLPFIDMENLSPNLLGQTVVVLGNPLGYGSSVSRGILSATNRTVTIDNSEYKDLIQTDAAINPGNSGGPIIDIGGRLVGVSSVKMAYTPQGVPTQGIGFGIPAQRVREKVNGFRSAASKLPPLAAAGPAAGEGTATRRFFGLQLQNLTDELVQAFGYGTRTGVLVADVEPGSPAEGAGLQRGLVIYKVGRYEVSTVEQIESLLGRAKQGTVVDLLVVLPGAGGRSAQQIRTVTLTAR